MKARKSILISTLIMAGGALSPLPAFATVERNGQTYWTFEEMWELKNTVEKEIADLCGDDFGCEENQRFSMMDQDERYRLLDLAWFQNVTLTAINPGRETIKFFYNDMEDWMMRRYTGDEKFPLQEFVTFWVDNEELEASAFHDNRNVLHYSDLILAGSDTGEVIPLFYGSTEKDGENWFEPYREIEVSVAGSGIAKNREGYFHQLGLSNGRFIGVFDYLSCLNSPDYKDGMECRLMYSLEQGGVYLPFEVEDETIESAPVEEISLTTENPVPEIPEVTKIPEEKSVAPASVPKLAIVQKQEPKADDIELPNANGVSKTLAENSTTSQESKPVTLHKKDTRSFFGLVFAVMAAAVIGIVWLIFPFKRKKRQKSQKKS